MYIDIILFAHYISIYKKRSLLNRISRRVQGRLRETSAHLGPRTGGVYQVHTEYHSSGGRRAFGNVRTSTVRAAGGFEVWARVKDTEDILKSPGQVLKGLRVREIVIKKGVYIYKAPIYIVFS